MKLFNTESPEFGGFAISGHLLRAHLQSGKRNETRYVPKVMLEPLAVTLPVHYRYITVTLPLHYRYITGALPVHYRCNTGTSPLHYRCITVT